MAKWEFVIALKDKDGKRSRKGDFIAYKPYPWNWGKEETNNYLVVTIDNLTEQQAAELCSPHYPGGKKYHEMNPLESTPEYIAKRRYRFPIEDVEKLAGKKIDNDKLFDFTKHYQPLKEDDIAFDMKKHDIVHEWKYTAAGTNPTRPATPSVIVTFKKISSYPV
jgi:hypothetical protein